MNLKKYLQQQAEKDAEIFLDKDDELFIQQLVQNGVSEQVAKPKLTKSKKFRAVLCGATIVIVAAIIIFPSVFVNRGGNNVFYNDANIQEIACSIEEMQTNIKYFNIDESIGSNDRIMLNYDTITNDNLYYTVEGSTVLSQYKFYIVVNEHYDYNYNFAGTLITQNLTDYVLNYTKSTVNGINKVTVNYSGYIQLETEKVYIEYQQLIDIGEQAFFDDIESIIKAKN